MALKNKSEVNMIQGPEFINLQPLDVNPLMQKCEIKVFYLGHNRNGSYINRETALEMAKTLRGTPIVAAFNKDKEDFGDHGHVMHIEDGEVTFTVKTIPYGFVAPDAEVWFQNFTDTDEFDNSVERTYLMTTGYLWSGQFEELTKVINEGQPQSMELDADSLQGHWATDNNLGVDFFIINDATFSKLCILGDNVEPCYEGASVTSPEVSKNFSKDSEFQQTLFSMMNDLQIALNSKGGLNMSENELINDSVETAEEQPVLENELEQDEVVESPSVENEEFSNEEVEVQEAVETDDNSAADEFVDKKKDEEDAGSEDKDEDDADDSNDDADDDPDDDDDDQKKPKNQHSLEEFEALQAEIDSLRAENEELRNFKLAVENRQKDALIASYHMLSDEDKAEVIAHKSEFSLDEIKAKLAVIYVEKNVNFDMIDGQEEVEDDPAPTMTFSLDEEASEGVPAFIEALRHTNK